MNGSANHGISRPALTRSEVVEIYWLSDTVHGDRPSVLDEVRQGLEVVERSLLDVVPRFDRDLEAALQRVYPERSSRVPSLLRFGSWIGPGLLKKPGF